MVCEANIFVYIQSVPLNPELMCVLTRHRRQQLFTRANFSSNLANTHVLISVAAVKNSWSNKQPCSQETL